MIVHIAGESGYLTPADQREGMDENALRLVLAAALSPTSSCIDVGSHRGSFLRHCLRLAPAGHHLAYEPLPHLHARLCEEFPQVDVRRKALSNRRGEADFLFVPRYPGHSGFRRRSYPTDTDLEKITVQVEDLDSALGPDFAPTVIKIDVEGAEREVLEGAMRTICRHKPILVFEHGAGAAPYYGTRPTDIYALLCTRARLRIFDLDGNGPFDETEFERAFELGDRWNFFARP